MLRIAEIKQKQKVEYQQMAFICGIENSHIDPLTEAESQNSAKPWGQTSLIWAPQPMLGIIHNLKASVSLAVKWS